MYEYLEWKREEIKIRQASFKKNGRYTKEKKKRIGLIRIDTHKKL
jgi:C-terminal processing protease CtpA/Prc